MMRALASLALAAFLGATGFAPGPAAAQSVSAVVDAAFEGVDGALVGGLPIYRTIGAALAAAPAQNPAPHVIHIRAGRYREKLTVDKPHVHFRGDGRDVTVLTYDAAAGLPAPGGGTWGTRGSYTLRIAAPDFRLENMTVENGFDYPANAAKPDTDPTKIQGAQAVAVLTDEGSDRAVFRDCKLSGYQDTLFANSGRQYYHRCTILGHVDFIFGAGQAVFHETEIVSRDRGSETNNGYIAAPSTLLAQPYGFLFLDCRLRKESAGMAPASVALARPWHPSGNPQAVGSAVFVNCHMDDHIGARGWERMGSTLADGSRIWWEPEQSRFFEYGSTGPGAIVSPTRRVLTDEQAAYYTAEQVLRGWTPPR